MHLPCAQATWLNLGHTLRKQARLVEAVGCYERALSLAPRSAGTAAALGFCRHLQGDLPWCAPQSGGGF